MIEGKCEECNEYTTIIDWYGKSLCVICILKRITVRLNI